MAFVDSEVEDGAHAVQDALSVKIVVAGGFGVGKTTFVGAVSEIEPLRTEALMTEASTSMDDLSMFAAEEFDAVVHPVSTCYVPDVQPVFREVAR